MKALDKGIEIREIVLERKSGGKSGESLPPRPQENIARSMANNVRLLLVDDNPMVLGMLRGALTPLAIVTTATDAADALLKAVDDPPDLLVSDYRMPGMDGRQLVEKLRSRPRTAEAAVILVATKADISEKLSTPDLPVDDFVEKPFFLREATQRIKRVIDKIALEKMAKTVPSDGVLRGSLLQMNVIDLVQSLEMGRKSCSLTLTNKRRQVRTVFQRRPGHARHLRLAGRGSGRIQGSALDGWKLRGQFRRQDDAADHPAEHSGLADGRPAPAGRVAARRRRKTRRGGRRCPPRLLKV